MTQTLRLRVVADSLVDEYGPLLFAIRCDQCPTWWRDAYGNVLVYQDRDVAETARGRHDRHEHA